ncbi:sel1 repeat family protein [Limnobacter humi]|uniref:Sel1 repeat family protein n=1 Tax=Limnobacter humi TaxID=1778671 RepID=A0ABT1WFD8_9BURK|nr:tetratricopeptide repeat protein [Limnobacter humi]MCQ8896224.1 sel1 repeat family protein [Limnobacter humi]
MMSAYPSAVLRHTLVALLYLTDAPVVAQAQTVDQVTQPAYPNPTVVNSLELHKANLRKAETGDAVAQTAVGLSLIEGDVVPRDLKAGRVWLGKAATQNHVTAQYYLGQLLMLDVLGANPADLTKQLTEGLGWLRRAAREQYRPAQLLYAQTVLDSKADNPFGHSKVEAESILLQCADTYRPCTYHALARLDREPLDTTLPCTANERCETIRRLLYNLAASNDAQAMLRLAGIQGEDSTYWIRRAARLGHPQACLDLAMQVINGQVPLQPEDPALASLLNTSAEQGEVQAMYLLGQLLYEGKRIPYNRPLAMQWLERASAKGHEPSTVLLEKMQAVTKLTPVPNPAPAGEDNADANVVQLPVLLQSGGQAQAVTE